MKILKNFEIVTDELGNGTFIKYTGEATDYADIPFAEFQNVEKILLSYRSKAWFGVGKTVDKISEIPYESQWICLKNSDNTYTVLDGKQRTLTLLAFYENRFPYKGLYYNDLSFRDKAHFLNYRVSVSEVDEISEEQILRYFISLNTAGKTMDKAHIEKVRKMIEKN